MNVVLSSCNSFDGQVDKLVEFLKVDESEMKQRGVICENLNELYAKFLPGSHVTTYGSTLTGLACKGSDMDLTLLIDEYLKLNENKQMKPPKPKEKSKLKQQGSSDSSANSDSNNMENEKLAFDIDENTTDSIREQNNNEYFTENVLEHKCKEILNLEFEEAILVATKILQRHASGLQDMRNVSNARCPVVRFYHDKTKINCELSLNNFIAVANSRLIELYMNLEPHLRRLIFLIRYWCKQKNLHGQMKLNSYTLIWMIVFYLQQIKRVPNVQFLATLAADKKLIHGWNCAFETNVDRIRAEFKKVENGFSETEEPSFIHLLKGFFEFYSSFNFNSTVLSPGAGAVETTSASLISKASSINVQDPFDLSHNLAANVNEKTVERFKSECYQSTSVLKHNTSPRKSANKCWGLSTLLTRKPLEYVPAKSSNNADNSFKLKLISKISDDKREIKFTEHLLKDCLMFDEVCEQKDISLKTIKRKRAPALNQICAEVDSLGLNCSPKRIKVSTNPEEYVCVLESGEKVTELYNSDDEGDNVQKKIEACYHVNVNHNTWLGRRNVRRDLQKQITTEISALELEKMISRKILEQMDESQNYKSAPLEFRILFLSETDESQMESDNEAQKSYLRMRFDPLNENKSQSELNNLTTLVHFLDIYINNCFEKYFSAYANVSA